MFPSGEEGGESGGAHLEQGDEQVKDRGDRGSPRVETVQLCNIRGGT